MHLQFRYPTHSRNPSWEQTQYSYKNQQKFYYNYRTRNDDSKLESREQIPTFGGSINNKTIDHYPRFNEQPYRIDINTKYRASLQHRNKSYNDFSYNYDKKTNAVPQNIRQETSYARNYPNHQLKIHTSSNPRNDLERATEKKITNIDKINQKIKKILNTLNQQQKKIAQHQNYKHGNKNNLNPNRIKTQGQQGIFVNKENYSNLSLKYAEPKNYRNEYQTLHKRNLSGQQQSILGKNPQKPEIKNYGQENYKKRPPLEQKSENYTKFRKILIEDDYPVAQTINVQKQEQFKTKNDSHQKKKMDKNKFLNGTNVKSTDSLNITANVNIRKQRQAYRLFQANINHRTPPKNNSPYDRISDNFNKNGDSLEKQYNAQNSSNHQSLNKGKRLERQEKNLFNDRRQNLIPRQTRQIRQARQTRQKIMSYQKDKKKQKQLKVYSDSKQQHRQFHRIGNLSNFGHQFDSIKVEKTPPKPRHQRSQSKYDKSEKSCKLSNGKDLDAQIQKIQKKINEFENIKKSFNIQENQNSKKSRIDLDRSLNKYRQSKSSSNLKVNNYSNNKGGSKDVSRDEINIIPPKQSQNLKTIGVAEFESKSFQFYEKTQSSFFPNDQYREVQINLPKPFKMVSKKNTRRNDANSGIKQIQSTFMSQERQYTHQKQTIKLLISSLCRQIQLDTDLRNLKKWFNRRPSQQKWRQLAKQLNLRNINTNQQQNKQIFIMTEQEDNPFFTSRDEEGSYQQLINSFLNSQRHWIDNLQHKFLRQDIQNSIIDMDIDKKGQITIEDMVRYINIESDKYYRNRDLSLIYRRLSGTQGQVTSEYILTEFCQH